MMKAAVVVALGLARASSGVRADPLLIGPTFGSVGGVALTGSDEEISPRDWDCRHWQKIIEAPHPENGPMPPCDEGSKFCDIPEFFCDLRGSDTIVEGRCGASDGNKQRSEKSCGDAHCRDVPTCMCGDRSKTCMEKTCVNLQRENCPNSMVDGSVCEAGEDTCDVDGFECDLRKGGFVCTAFGNARKNTRGRSTDADDADAKPADDDPDKSSGHAIGTPLSSTSAVIVAALVASAMSRM